MKVFLLFLIIAPFAKIYTQVPTAAWPGHVWIVAHTENQNGKKVKISGHWEGKRAPSSKYVWMPDRSCEFCGYYKKLDVSDTASSTGNTKKVAINENNTTGISTNKIIRAGGSMQKSGELKNKNERFCFSQQMEAHKIADKFGLMKTDSKIFPGNIIQGKNFINGAYTEITKPMNPLKLYIPNIMFTDENRAIKTISEPSKSTLSTAVLPMVNNTFEGKLQADLQFESSEVLSRSDMLLNCNIHADGFFMDLENNFSISKSKYSTTIMLSFTQKYFTVTVDMPQADSIFKDRSVPDDDMLYIRSVTYGRRAVLFVTVDSTATTIMDTLKANYDAIVKSVSLSANFLKTKRFQNATVTGYVFGGAAGSAAKIFNPDPKKVIDEFYKVLQSGAEFSKENFGRPIEYEVAFLKTGELASIEYNIKEARKVCDEGNQMLKITLNSIKALKVDDGGNDKEAEIYGIVSVYCSTLDFPVTDPINRFGEEGAFNNQNKKKEFSLISLPKGGKPSIPPLGNYLWKATRQEQKTLKQGNTMIINKSVNFLYNSQTPFNNIKFFANLDEADDDDDDELMEGGNDEILNITPPAPAISQRSYRPNSNKKQLHQLIKSRAHNGTVLDISYTIEILQMQ